MNAIDWSIFILILFIVITIKHFKLNKADNNSIYEKSTLHYGFKIIAVQSFIYTFISLPGQAYSQGMTFLQLYLGIPLAVFIVIFLIIPKYKKHNTKSAFEYIKAKSNKRVYYLTSIIYLILRLLVLTITFYATAMILSILLKIDFKILLLIISAIFIVLNILFKNKTNLFPRRNQLLYAIIITTIIFLTILYKLPEGMYLEDTLSFTASFDKLTVIDSDLALKDNFDLLKCLVNGTILFVALLSIDTKILQIYRQSKYSDKTKDGLIINGLFNVPFHFFILLTGCVLFTFYQFNDAPLHYNPHNVHTVYQSEYAEQYDQIKQEYQKILNLKKEASFLYSGQIYQNYSNQILKDQILSLTENANKLQLEAKKLIKKANHNVEVNDSDFILLHFINFHVPTGIAGVIMALFFICLLSIGLHEINWLSKKTKKLLSNTNSSILSQPKKTKSSDMVTILIIILVLLLVYNIPVFLNLIQILWAYSSLFSGTLLGILLVTMYLKSNNKILFYSILLTQIAIILLYITTPIHYLWYNSIGLAAILILVPIANLISKLFSNNSSNILS
ncbi:hypothetical protein VSP10_13395 [Myroides odoratimimus]|uniref:hypothetical protein n=1 Tax=Myroides odoratimimus TaxID=76832 RepID=UPI002DB68F4F|nr:hypothetical protein [Myroides odoratimimus]MEC4053780.1 hypothetical protein [Myroides odoratimimus]